MEFVYFMYKCVVYLLEIWNLLYEKLIKIYIDWISNTCILAASSLQGNAFKISLHFYIVFISLTKYPQKDLYSICIDVSTVMSLCNTNL